jgi:hypothetical protein
MSQTAAAVALQRVEDQKCRYRSGLLEERTGPNAAVFRRQIARGGGTIVVRIAPWNTPSLLPFFSQS